MARRRRRTRTLITSSRNEGSVDAAFSVPISVLPTDFRSLNSEGKCHYAYCVPLALSMVGLRRSTRPLTAVAITGQRRIQRSLLAVAELHAATRIGSTDAEAARCCLCGRLTEGRPRDDVYHLLGIDPHSTIPDRTAAAITLQARAEGRQRNNGLMSDAG